MFLKAARTRAKTTCNDNGSTLISVLIIMLVLTIVGLTLANIVINTSGMVMTGRDSGESRAAADAGLADVTAKIQREEIVCIDGGTPPAPVASSPGDDVTYSVTISCGNNPVSARSELTLVSTGVGKGGSSTVTSVTYGPGLAGALTTVLAPPGGLSLTDANSSAKGNVLVDDGNFTCSNNAQVIDAVIVRDGAVHNSNSCVVGKVIASQGVRLDTGATVTGDVYALNGNFSLDAPAKIGGNVYVNGDVVLNGGEIAGSLTATGTVTGSAAVAGGIHTGSFQSPPEIAATAFEWIDVPYTVPSGPVEKPATCPSLEDIKKIADYSVPRVLDWRACNSLINFFETPLALKTDITIYLKTTINLDRVALTSVDGNPHQFHLIMPDETPDGSPTGACTADTRFDIYRLKMDPLISGIAYSPCQINPGGATWNGIIYGKVVQSFNGSNLTYKDLSLPNGKKLRETVGPIINMRDVG